MVYILWLPLYYYIVNSVLSIFVFLLIVKYIVGGILPRQKRRAANQAASKEIQAIYHRLSEVLENIALLVETQPLTDAILLMVRRYYNSIV